MSLTLKAQTVRSKFGVVAPIGAFGNHVRWFILLDQQFDLEFLVNEESYNNLKGSSWPDYDDYYGQKFDGVEQWIQDEIKQKCNLAFDSLENKLTAFKEQIYPPIRTWHNWLWYEWYYRKSLDTLLDFKHSYEVIVGKEKVVLCRINPELAWRSYVKFNSNLNVISKEMFMTMIAELTLHNEELAGQHPDNIMMLDTDILFNPILDRDWYKKLITWFGLNDNYETAQIMHGLWYEGHKRSEREIVRDLQKIYGL